MDVFHNVGMGFAAAFTPNNLLVCFLGVVLGTVIGLMPGLGAATGMSLLLPITIGMDPLPSFILLAGIYYGVMHGAIVSAVLINTPGDAAHVVTVMDGHKLARAGRAGPALVICALSSFLAGTLSIPFVMTLTPLLAKVSLHMGPPEISAVILIGLVGVIGFVGTNRLKGFAMAALGLLIATIGVDPETGTSRYTFGVANLTGGVDFLYVVIGTFALAQVLITIGIGQPSPIKARFKDMYMSADDWRRGRLPILRGGILGLVVGMIPGAGATVASFLSYDVERRIGKRHGRILGTGLVEGIAGPQAADNAAVNGTFVPTLALGIPGNAATAVMLGAFLLHGIQPGPLVLTTQAKLVWGLLASFYIGNVLLLVLNVPLAPVFASILRIKYSYLYPVILMVCCVGAFSVNDGMAGVWMMVIIGLIGWIARRLDYPMVPMILSVILGPLLEQSVVQSAEIGRGSMTVYLHRPIALALLGIVVLMAVGPPVVRRLTHRSDGEGGSAAPEDSQPRARVDAT